MTEDEKLKASNAAAKVEQDRKSLAAAIEAQQKPRRRKPTGDPDRNVMDDGWDIFKGR